MLAASSYVHEDDTPADPSVVPSNAADSVFVTPGSCAPKNEPVNVVLLNTLPLDTKDEMPGEMPGYDGYRSEAADVEVVKIGTSEARKTETMGAGGGGVGGDGGVGDGGGGDGGSGEGGGGDGGAGDGGGGEGDGGGGDGGNAEHDVPGGLSADRFASGTYLLYTANAETLEDAFPKEEKVTLVVGCASVAYVTAVPSTTRSTLFPCTRTATLCEVLEHSEKTDDNSNTSRDSLRIA